LYPLPEGVDKSEYGTTSPVLNMYTDYIDFGVEEKAIYWYLDVFEANE
jgi:hypothetical protein